MALIVFSGCPVPFSTSSLPICSIFSRYLIYRMWVHVSTKCASSLERGFIPLLALCALSFFFLLSLEYLGSGHTGDIFFKEMRKCTTLQ
jgi:hypothetical protein